MKKSTRQDHGDNCGKFRSIWVAILSFLFLLSSCTQLQKPQSEPFYAQTSPPAKQEFRWSNGRSPKSFDPARASAPPETDIIRALFEGLTNTDAKTLLETPGVAEKWTSADNYKKWTFYLRDDAKWSNGKQVTAQDFVRSWQRLAEMGGQAAHNDLLRNIVGVPVQASDEPETVAATPDILLNSLANKKLPVLPQVQNSNVSVPQPVNTKNVNANADSHEPIKTGIAIKNKFGFAAENDRVLVVSLVLPDKDFPKLVAHPIFSPIYGDGKEFESGKPDAAIQTNGAFRISALGADGLTLERSDTYWNRKAIKIERVRFVPMENPEAALEAYRAGNLDAVTNGEFAPLALKLLSAYQDFRRTAHNGINFYEVNSAKAPFNDRRVRQALSSAIERERLTEGEMEGTAEPAMTFLPFGKQSNIKISQDKDLARDLLDEAGFPDGENFPVIRLLVNRNDAQQRIARSVARMWKQNLNLDTEIIVKEQAELELARKSGDFDLVRRGVVFPTADEEANLRAIFRYVNERKSSQSDPLMTGTDKARVEKRSSELNQNSLTKTDAPVNEADTTTERAIDSLPFVREDAILEYYAIPLYFPVSYSLVKPYVSGFELNSLDAPSLKDVLIDNEWQPKKVNGES